ncbi:MAG: bifunctional hexulose-6-phosphate synthase/ribonuclease regulator [Omnitrophica bacterium RBG_13_46_9]|nr:MAG: bifunctional hexulose-6-phosphate synthase/ribonuclease regulator [Omnitrophica bacterium RBG_13_46_9]
MKPILQLALDFVNLKRALKVAEEAMRGGVDWLEAGTPLIKSEGLDAVRELRKRFPKATIVADMKTMDVGRIETEAAAKAGADVVCVLACASDSTIRECVEAGKNYGVRIEADLLEISEDRIERRAREVEELGVDYIGVHVAIDEQMKGKDAFSRLRKVAKAVNIPIACAGGINSETAPQAVKAGAHIVVVGGAINKAKDPALAARRIRKAISSGKGIETKLFKRVSAENVYKFLKEVSTSNISDAMHRTGAMNGIYPISQGLKMAGPALTVRTYPGDWAKTVEAVDRAEKGHVIVIDAGGVGPAVWGELATHGAIQRKLAGVVIDGATRDTPEIRKSRFPVFSKLVTPAAGEPKGFGEIGVPVMVGGISVKTGDWVVGDDDGVVCISKDKVTEITNRAMAILEQENRLREEIDRGSTLGKVIELLKWEKR